MLSWPIDGSTENRHSLESTTSFLLLRCALNIPGVVEFTICNCRPPPPLCALLDISLVLLPWPLFLGAFCRFGFWQRTLFQALRCQPCFSTLRHGLLLQSCSYPQRTCHAYQPSLAMPGEPASGVPGVSTVVTPESVVAVGAVFPALGIIVVALRFYTRYRQKARLMLDDWLTVPALVGSITRTTLLGALRNEILNAARL